MMIVLHRGRKVLAGAWGKLPPRKKLAHTEPCGRIRWGAKPLPGTSKSPLALEQQINIFSGSCGRRENQRTNQSSTQGAGAMGKLGVSYRNNFIQPVKRSSRGEARRQSSEAQPEAPPSTRPLLVQECVCSAAPSDKGKDAATCPHLSELIFWPRFMSKAQTSHCCILILVYSKASQPSGFKEKRYEAETRV